MEALEKIFDTVYIEAEESFEDATLHKDLGFFKYVHRYLVKPIAKFYSSRILRKEIIKAVGDIKGKTVIDVSCGDDETVLHLAKDAKWTVANDISIHSMLPVIEKSNGDDVTFINKNFFDLKWKKADVVLCKNTLHHMSNTKQLYEALKKLDELGDKIIIMDVENPKLTRKARLWNAYYTFLLKDQGGFFISFDQFRKMLSAVFADRKIETKKIDTIKGNYMLGVIT